MESNDINLLFSTEIGIPTPNSGGGHKIIYELLKDLKYKRIIPFFLSYNLYQQIILSSNNPRLLETNAKLRTQIGNKLYDKFPLYEKIVSNPYYLNWYNRRIKKYFNNKANELDQYDVLNSHDIMSLSYLSKNTNIIKILSIHSKGSLLSERDEGRKLEADEKKRIIFHEDNALKQADRIIFPSNAAKELFEKDIKERKSSQFLDKSHIIYNGIDLNWINTITSENNLFQKYGISGNYNLKILNVAEHIYSKNVELLISTIKMLKIRRNINPLLINFGSGYLTSTLKETIRKENLENNVFLLGKVDNETVLKFMKKMDLLLMPSDRVVFDMIILEAMASGICILASKLGGNLEIIKHGVNGFFLNSFAPKEIAKQILNINFKKTRQDALETVKRFSIEQMQKKYIDLYMQGYSIRNAN